MTLPHKWMPVLVAIAAHIIQYRIRVQTASERGSGTDANVYATIYGKDGETGKLPLKTSLTNRNKFEAGQCDEFLIDAANVGDLTKLLYVALFAAHIARS